MKSPTMNYMWVFKPVSWRVYDGDTLLDLVLDLGFNLNVEIKARLSGIDAPEVRGQDKELGLKSRDFLRMRLAEAQMNGNLMIESHRKQEKFGRWLITIWDGDVNINKLMVEEGQAIFKEY